MERMSLFQACSEYWISFTLAWTLQPENLGLNHLQWPPSPEAQTPRPLQYWGWMWTPPPRPWITPHPGITVTSHFHPGCAFRGDQKFPKSWACNSKSYSFELFGRCSLEARVWGEDSSVQSLRRIRLCDPMDCSRLGFPVLHQLPELALTSAHYISDAIQPSHPLSSPSPAFHLSQQKGLF